MQMAVWTTKIVHGLDRFRLSHSLVFGCVTTTTLKISKSDLVLHSGCYFLYVHPNQTP